MLILKSISSWEIVIMHVLNSLWNVYWKCSTMHETQKHKPQ